MVENYNSNQKRKEKKKKEKRSFLNIQIDGNDKI